MAMVLIDDSEHHVALKVNWQDILTMEVPKFVTVEEKSKE